MEKDIGPNKIPSETVSTGDGTQSFDDFYHRRSADALRYAWAILGTDEAVDVCQEAWLKVWRAWGSADPKRVDAWAFRIIRNCCIDHQRVRHVTNVLDETDLPAVLAAEDVATPQLEVAEAMPLLRSLGKPLREALWLREVVGLSYSEIAELQEVPIGTVMSRLHAARKRAAQILRKEGW